jgi:hypothetical protein
MKAKRHKTRLWCISSYLSAAETIFGMVLNNIIFPLQPSKVAGKGGRGGIGREKFNIADIRHKYV